MYNRGKCKSSLLVILKYMPNSELHTKGLVADVVFSPDLLPFTDLGGKIVVVIDILRASSTITTALANGAVSIHPVLTPEDAFRVAAESSEKLCCGERKGLKVEGFDLGNSPRKFTSKLVSGKQIVLTTTNGTRTINACVSAKSLLVGSFLNLSSIVDFLQKAKASVVFVCAGRMGQFCTEDSTFAGACLNRMPDWQLSDSARTALLIYKHHQNDLLAMLKACDHGRYLEQIGLTQDLNFCAQVDHYPIVPRLEQQLISIDS